ncbi:MAG: ABC transporter permease [Cyclobacteriaceae bacterium]|nr:ABC transporter permease [Cyclobacteriaceae bacterium]
MLINYLKISLRTITKHKLFSIITIVGMSLSLASCLLIGLFVWDELSFDQYHPDGDRTFRIYNVRSGNDGVTTYLPIVPPTFGPTLEKDYAEVESTLRMMNIYGSKLFELKGEKTKESKGVYAENTFFDMLTVNLVQGDAGSALEKPNSVVLSKTLSEKYFGDSNSVGENITLSGNEMLITGVYEDFPVNSHLQINYVISFASILQEVPKERIESWIWQQFFTYVKFKPGTDVTAFESKLADFVKQYAYPTIEPAGFTYLPHLQNIKNIHLHSSSFEWEIAQRGNAQSVYVLSAAALFILVIASLNFVNLSTARSLKRMKEVGVRKVAGALRTQLIFQFTSESITITLIGLVIAISITQIGLPYLNDFAGKSISSPFNLPFITAVVIFSLLLGGLAGSYPAWHLSRFRPATVLYNRSGASAEGNIYRNILVVLQFMFSFFLIIGSLVVLAQNDLLHNKDLGFDKEQLMVMTLSQDKKAEHETVKQEFLKNPSVEQATIGYGLPGDIIAGDGIIEPLTGKSLPANLFCVDFDYVKTLGMEIVAGRDFSREFTSDGQRAFIINETAAKSYGFGTPEEAIGHPIHWEEWIGDSTKRGEVVGVVKDFHFKSLREQMSPVVMHIYPQVFYTLTLRVKSDNLTATIAQVKSTYEKLVPEQPFSYKFLDENYDSMYKSEEKLSGLFSLFTGLAIVVACMGLFGLVEFSVNQRIREIGIRKVFGASINSLLLLLTRKYFALILVAFVVIVPVSYYTAQQWLSTFAYRIELSPWIYLEACGLIISITIATVSFQSVKAALTNPATTLRTE